MRWNDRIGRRIKLSDLHILLAVAQSGSMSRAANELAVSHPVVSRSISDLEHVLGVKLLERTRRGVELTEPGRALLKRSYAAFDELRQGVKDIEFLTDPAAGEVRIGTTPPLAASFLSTVVDRLVKRYQRMTFHVVIDSGEAQRISLSERRLDLLVFRKSTTPAHQLNFETLFESQYVVAAGKDSPWVGRRGITLADLTEENWAFPEPDDTFGSFVMEAFRASHLAIPRARIVTSTLEMRANLLRTGRYLTILPDFWLRFPETHPFIRRLPVELPVAAGPIGIVTLKDRMPSPPVQRFIECAREVAKPLAKRKQQKR
jgi:molybdate transport repressor ModE-like protein